MGKEFLLIIVLMTQLHSVSFAGSTQSPSQDSKLNSVRSVPYGGELLANTMFVAIPTVFAVSFYNLGKAGDASKVALLYDIVFLFSFAGSDAGSGLPITIGFGAGAIYSYTGLKGYEKPDKEGDNIPMAQKSLQAFGGVMLISTGLEYYMRESNKKAVSFRPFIDSNGLLGPGLQLSYRF
jgi:hypothetical protein